MSDNKSELDQNRETIARFVFNFQREGDGKCYCPYKMCKGLNTRRLLIKIAKIHCRDNAHIEGDLNIIHW